MTPPRATPARPPAATGTPNPRVTPPARSASPAPVPPVQAPADEPTDEAPEALPAPDPVPLPEPEEPATEDESQPAPPTDDEEELTPPDSFDDPEANQDTAPVDETASEDTETASAPEPEAAAPKASVVRGAARERPNRAVQCTLAVDVRGLPGNFQRSPVTHVLDESGRLLWPDPDLVRDLPTEAFDDGRLHRYVRATQDLSRFPNLTVVQAARLAQPRQAPRASYLSDVILGEAAAERFETADRGCLLLYILP